MNMNEVLRAGELCYAVRARALEIAQEATANERIYGGIYSVLDALDERGEFGDFEAAAIRCMFDLFAKRIELYEDVLRHYATGVTGQAARDALLSIA